ncbi:MAG: hypothetical protein R3356_06050 [Eudoraea sp.]|nr:hypothetical protein [Eudoraea sp.]
MSQIERLKEFRKSVQKKFNIYNTLFLNIPYTDMENIGTLVPLLFQQCEKGLKAGKNPSEILDNFFTKYAGITTEKDRIDFMFRIIQYVERQVVLYDSVEDAAFPKIHKYTSSLSLKDYFQFVAKNNAATETPAKNTRFCNINWERPKASCESQVFRTHAKSKSS